jgi:glucose/arabinose dehydrogenase
LKTSFLLLFTLLCSASLRAEPVYELRHAYPGVKVPDCPVSLAFTREETPRSIVVLQRGMAHVLPSDRSGTETPVFLDFREKLKEEIHFEAGFHSIIFHPDFAINRRVFLSYSQSNPRRNVLSEMQVPIGEIFAADPASEKILMEIPHQLADHYSGSMAFGPDGMLYYSVGDGGFRDDPMGMAQNPFLLQGKILRIDINRSDGARPYHIPEDNPFFESQEWRGEVYALGFRNPWGISFDPLTGYLWAADVGQDLHEEVNFIVKGGNYGWGERDGNERLAAKEAQTQPEGKEYRDPVFHYSRLNGDGVCIVGGMVYRGKRLPELDGCYLFGDWGIGRIRALRPAADPAAPAEEVKDLFQPTEGGFNPTQLCADESGELLILSHAGFIESR